MAKSAAGRDSTILQVMAETYAVNDRMNQLVLEHLDRRAWRAAPPGKKGRTIAAIFSHVHNVRCKWLRLSAPHLKLPAPLHRARCTPEQAKAALAESAKRCCEMLSEALANPAGRIEKFRRDGWARPWAPGAAMFAYMIAHDAHHRGQVCMLARQLGHPLPEKINSGMWNWEKLWKACGITHPPQMEKLTQSDQFAVQGILELSNKISAKLLSLSVLQPDSCGNIAHHLAEICLSSTALDDEIVPNFLSTPSSDADKLAALSHDLMTQLEEIRDSIDAISSDITALMNALNK